jgi:hypothetical protein
MRFCWKPRPPRARARTLARRTVRSRLPDAEAGGERLELRRQLEVAAAKRAESIVERAVVDTRGGAVERDRVAGGIRSESRWQQRGVLDGCLALAGPGRCGRFLLHVQPLEPRTSATSRGRRGRGRRRGAPRRQHQ